MTTSLLPKVFFKVFLSNNKVVFVTQADRDRLIESIKTDQRVFSATANGEFAGVLIVPTHVVAIEEATAESLEAEKKRQEGGM